MALLIRRILEQILSVINCVVKGKLFQGMMKYLIGIADGNISLHVGCHCLAISLGSAVFFHKKNYFLRKSFSDVYFSN